MSIDERAAVRSAPTERSDRRRRVARAGRIVPIAIVQIGGTMLFSRLGRAGGSADGGFQGRGPWNGDGSSSAIDPITLTPVAVALLVAGVIALVIRHRAPTVVLVITLATTIGYALAVSPRGPFVAALTMALVNAVFRMRRRDALVAAAIAVVVLPWADVLTGRSSVPPWGTMMFALAWATATISIAELARIRMLRAAEARQARVDAERRRADEERVRIARELHDSVAHNMSLINLQAGVALHLGADLPATTQEALANIRDASRDALVELRTVLGVLRGVDQERATTVGPDPASVGGADPVSVSGARRSERSPVPGIDRLPDLVDRARAAGLPVSLEIVGDPTSVAPIVDRSAFRIVQESVTNVMKHAPGTTATVQLDIGDNVVEIDVRNVRVGVPGGEGVGGADVGGAAVGGAVIGPSGLGGPGNGLIGMRERATAVGGTFSAGPLPDGGWRVLARLPRGEAAHARTTGGTTDRTTSGTTGGATDA